ncbi:hypothetical protein RhiirA4_477502 [Rhizophagus irregularis]|uniref:Uncharacterized protein n=1 Tax=Rhizophagus irregularis TaxID=588596 RepID=A0A2I1HDD8_9GLOM|nr:hypothetical protein RhiirA4_477502 [Rhizophagus irregularis]
MYNFKKEFDWRSTLEFLPTYEVLYRRNTNKIENDKCKRCGKEEKEDWEHIWLCEDNEFTINEIVQESIYRFEKYLKDLNQNEEIEILRTYNFEFIR